MYSVIFSNGTASYERSLAEAKRMVYETVKNSTRPDDFGKVYALDSEGYENGVEYEVSKRNGYIDICV